MTTYPSVQPDRSTLLRRALQGNAVFSSLSAIGSFAGAGWLSTHIGAPISVLIALGAGLLAYAAWLLFQATRPQLDRRAAWAAIIADELWVIASAVLVLTGWPDLTTTGGWVVGIVALLVADFAVLQYVGLRRLRG